MVFCRIIALITSKPFSSLFLAACVSILKLYNFGSLYDIEVIFVAKWFSYTKWIPCQLSFCNLILARLCICSKLWVQHTPKRGIAHRPAYFRSVYLIDYNRSAMQFGTKTKQKKIREKMASTQNYAIFSLLFTFSSLFSSCKFDRFSLCFCSRLTVRVISSH